MANTKQVNELQVHDDGMWWPKTPLRQRIAESFAAGMSRKQIATHLNCSYDYVVEALRDEDVKAHVARIRMQAAAKGGVQVHPKEIKEWAELAPMAQAFYEHLIKLGFEVEEKVERKIGETSEGNPIMAEEWNPNYSKAKDLGLKAAQEVVHRAWGKVPQRIDIDEMPGGDKIGKMSDAQLEAYRQELQKGTAPSIAVERVMRLTDAQIVGEDGDWQDAEILEVEDSDEFDARVALPPE